MRQISGKDLTWALERHGWVLRRIHGSHHIYGGESGLCARPRPRADGGRG